MERHSTDVVIIGAGLSGISMASLLGMKLPTKRYVVLEARDDVGGTWDLFRYPGVRSDSDMHTLGFSFHPWTDKDAIASGPKIKRYIHETIDRFGVRPNLRMGHRMVRADWNSDTARWTVLAERTDGDQVVFEAAYLFMGSGYYNYGDGHRPAFPGEAAFEGRIVHPQTWPEALDTAGKRIVVIGSGATAVTLVPSLAETAAHVTMLQRSPTYVVARPGRDRIANHFKDWLPQQLAYAGARWKNILIGRMLRRRFLKRPHAAGPMLVEWARKELPAGFDMQHFTPRHQPWEQRICLAPDGDFFRAIRDGRASVVTDTIERFVANGIKLASGDVLEADIIVTATGLNVERAPSLIHVDGEAVNLADVIVYKGVMYSNVPNFNLVFGYTGASWTLKADLTARFAIRVIAELDRRGADFAVPAADTTTMKKLPMVGFNSGYIVRSRDHSPKQSDYHPWIVHQDYLTDRRILLKQPIDDGVLRFARAGEWRAPAIQGRDEALEARVAAE